MTEKTFKVNMNCSACLMILQGLEDTPGIEKITGDVKDGRLTVTFNEDEISEQQVIEAISGEGEGYEVTPLGAAA